MVIKLAHKTHVLHNWVWHSHFNQKVLRKDIGLQQEECYKRSVMIMLVLLQHISLGGLEITSGGCSIGLTGLDWTRTNGKQLFPGLSSKNIKSIKERLLNAVWSKVLPQSWNLIRIHAVQVKIPLSDMGDYLLTWDANPLKSYFGSALLLFHNCEIKSLDHTRNACSFCFVSSTVCEADVFSNCGTKLRIHSPWMTCDP